jgi:hypothetical protein
MTSFTMEPCLVRCILSLIAKPISSNTTKGTSMAYVAKGSASGINGDIPFDLANAATAGGFVPRQIMLPGWP